MTGESDSMGLHTIDEQGRIDLDEDVFERTALKRGGECLVIASKDGGLTIIPVERDFDPKPSGQ